MSAPIQAERQRRLLSLMAEHEWDTLVVVGNAWRNDYLRFATDAGVIEGQAIAVVQRNGAIEVFTESPDEANRIAAGCPGVTTVWAPDPSVEAERRLLGMGNRRTAIAPGAIAPYRFTAGPLAGRFDDATALLDALMRRKSAGELEAIRRASALADEGYAVFREAARPGRAEYELVADLEAYYRSRGCPDNFMILGSGGVEVRGMHPPGERRLRPGDLVTTELTPSIDGYWSQICRTLVIGEPSAEQQAAFSVFLKALEAGIEAVRAGVTAGDVAWAENEVFRRQGLGEYVTSEYTRVRGHGLGLYVDGRPAVLENVDMVLEPDMTLVVHPNTYHPKAGYIVLGDSVRVTETGCEVLTHTPRVLFSMPG